MKVPDHHSSRQGTILSVCGYFQAIQAANMFLKFLSAGVQTEQLPFESTVAMIVTGDIHHGSIRGINSMLILIGGIELSGLTRFVSATGGLLVQFVVFHRSSR